MAIPLLTLASGRVPRGARLLAWSGLLLLAATWLLLNPGHTAAPRALPAAPHALLLPPDSPWVDRAELADPSGLFLRSPSPLAEIPVTSQPEATPFLAYGPDLRTQPGQALTLGFRPSLTPLQDPLQILLQPESAPFRTLGHLSTPSPSLQRPPQASLYSDSGELYREVEIPFEGEGKKLHKLLSVNILNIKNPAEFRLGIDSFGLQSKPFLTLSSGDSNFDQLALEWASRQAWHRDLPAGSYRLRVGP